MPRRTALLVLAAAVACGSPAPSPQTPARTQRLPVVSDAQDHGARPGNFTALAAPKAGVRTAGAAAGGPAKARVDEALGVPTFRWATERREPVAAARSSAIVGTKDAVERARAHLEGAAGTYALTAADVSGAEAFDVHDTGRGAVIVRFRQRLAGVEVFRGTTAVAMDRSGALVAQSGSLAPEREVPEGATFALDPAEAVARALADVSGEDYAAGDLVDTGPAGPYETYGLRAETSAARAAIFTRPARAKPVWFRLPGALEPAYYVEVGLGRLDARDSLDYGLVLSARDGRLLFRKDQLSHAFTYRVYASGTSPHFPYDGPQGFAGSPHPTGQPDGSVPAYVTQENVTLDYNPLRSKNAGDPWLAPGSTSTLGNNVDAYADLAAPDGYQAASDLRATAAGGAFLAAFDPLADPRSEANRAAAVTQLFYVTNWLHDWYYEAGFDEPSGNAQANNFGRGGLGSDRMRAEAQDFGGLDNANMATPADGGTPRMQMYLWQPPAAQLVRVNAPAAAAQTASAGVSGEFGPQTFDLTQDVVAVVDGTSPAGDGCSALTNGAALAGKIALVDRGACSFVAKAAAAQAAGAVGVLIRNVNETQLLVNMASDGTAAARSITVPVMLVDREPGKAVGDALTAGETVSVTLKRSASVLRDGDLDTTIVAHEWGHYISNRLVGDASGLDTNMAGGLGEGWSDFHALLLVVREEDTAVAANAGFAGAYGVGAYASGGDYPEGTPNDSYYWAIRRVPYSTDFTRNPLTFRHISDGEAIPTEAPGGSEIPVQFGASGANNSEVHNAGEVWSTMLWECYAALLNETSRLTFGEAQARMRDYLVESYKLTPSSPTLLDARDALLAAALARDPQDFAVFFEAFARRGAGIGAVAPNRYAPDNVGVVESYLAGPYLETGAVAIESITGACNDSDGVLDNGETATVSVPFQNVGTTALGASTVTVSSGDPRVTFPAGTTAAIAASAVFGTSTATFQVALAGAARGDIVPVTLTFPAGYLFTDEPRQVELRVNYDEAVSSAAAEGFESSLAVTAWPTQDSIGGGQAWTRIFQSAGQHTMIGPAFPVASDVRLVSPPIVLGTGTATVTFRHRHQFEGDAASETWFDGGVVELSQDGGTTWVDVGVKGKYPAGGPAYSAATLAAYDGNTNPLAGRFAFTGKSPGYPNFSLVTVDLGTTYAGKTVRLRFRIGTDTGTGGAGWELDDVAVSGATGLPFPALVNDRLICGAGGVVASAGQAQRVAEGSPVGLDASASAAEDPDAPLTFSWTQLSGPSVTLSSDTAAVATFTAPDVSGDTAFTFKVDVSGAGASSSAETVVTVVNVNKPPEVVVGPARKVDELTLVTLDGSASNDQDPGSTLTYRWEQVSGRAVALVDDDTAIATFTAPDVSLDSLLQFRLTVSDGEATTSATLYITIKDLNPATGGGGGGGGGGCGSTGGVGPLALLALAALKLRRRKPD